MTKAEIIERLKRAKNRAAIARATGLQYAYLSKLVYGEIENPGSDQVDKLRNYFLAQDVLEQAPGHPVENGGVARS
jgi:hypothetical protein